MPVLLPTLSLLVLIASATTWTSVARWVPTSPGGITLRAVDARLGGAAVGTAVVLLAVDLLLAYLLPWAGWSWSWTLVGHLIPPSPIESGVDLLLGLLAYALVTVALVGAGSSLTFRIALLQEGIRSRAPRRRTGIPAWQVYCTPLWLFVLGIPLTFGVPYTVAVVTWFPAMERRLAHHAALASEGPDLPTYLAVGGSYSESVFRIWAQMSGDRAAELVRRVAFQFVVALTAGLLTLLRLTVWTLPTS